MEPAAQHATASDGTRIAWESAGGPAPAVVLLDGLGCAGYVWRLLAPELARERRVLHLTWRGHGRSEAPADPARVTVEDAAGDVLAVLDAAGEPSAVLAGHSLGVQIALEVHRRAPGRVAGLMLMCGAPGRVLDTFNDSTALRSLFPWARALVERWPEVARSAFRTLLPTETSLRLARAFVEGAKVPREDLIRYFDDLSQVDPTLFVRMMASAAEHDATGHLRAVDVPTLVVAGERDTFTPMRLSVRIHQAIRGSELLVLEDASHVAPLEQPERLAEAVGSFLSRRVPAAAPPPSTSPSPTPSPASAATHPAPRRRTSASRAAPSDASSPRPRRRAPAARAASKGGRRSKTARPASAGRVARTDPPAKRPRGARRKPR